MSLTPYILVGGQSSRMGTDKAFLPWQGTTLLGHAIARLASFGPARLLSGDRANVPRQQKLAEYGTLVPDRTPGAGPLGGIDAALHDTPTDWLLLLPIDQPNLPSAALQHWAQTVLASAARVAWFVQASVPDLFPDPLPMLLHRSLAAPVAEALQQGERRLIPVLRRLAGPTLLEIPAPDPAWFLNLNRPEDLPAKNLSSPHPG